MVDKAPLSMQEVDDFPDESKPIRMCIEPNCDQPCVKRGRGYAKFCGEHLFNHTVDGSKTKPKEVETVKNTKVAETAERQARLIMQFLQAGFISNGDRYCAYAVGEMADPIATNLGITAQEIKLVSKIVGESEKYLALSLLITSITKLGLMIGVHHDWVPYAGPVKMLVPKPPEKLNPNDPRQVIPIRLVEEPVHASFNETPGPFTG